MPPPDKHVVAVAGATGNLGYLISMVLLSPHYRSFYSDVRLFIRNPGSSKAQTLAQLGGTLVKLDIQDQKALEAALQGVDAVVNALGSYDHDAKDHLLEGVLASGAVLYIPSEYGVDHRFNGFDHILWTDKRNHVDRARAERKGLKTVAIYSGLVLETVFRPGYGFDKENYRFNIVGSQDTKVTYTAWKDIARTVVQITTVALKSPSAIPDNIRIAGTTISWEDIRHGVLTECDRSLEIVPSEESVESFRKKTTAIKGTEDNAPEYIRLLMSEGKIDFSADNQNELVNPGGALWQWTPLNDYLRKIKGDF